MHASTTASSTSASSIASSRVEFLRAFPKVFRGTHVTHPAVRTSRGARVSITSLDEHGDLWASGEHVGPLPATIVAVPQALALVLPHGNQAVTER